MLLLVSLPSLCLFPITSAQIALTSTTFVYTGQFPVPGGPGCGLFVTYFAANEGQSVHIVFSSDVATDVFIATSSQYLEYNENATRPCPPASLSKIGTGVTKLSTDFVPPSIDRYYVWLGYQSPPSTMPDFSIEFDGIPTSMTVSTSRLASFTSTVVTASTAAVQSGQTGPLAGILILGLIFSLVVAILIGNVRVQRSKRKRRKWSTRRIHN